MLVTGKALNDRQLLAQGLVDHAWQQAVEAHEQALGPAQVAFFLLAANGIEQLLGDLRGALRQAGVPGAAPAEKG